jgi:hypothetical protein
MVVFGILSLLASPTSVSTSQADQALVDSLTADAKASNERINLLLEAELEAQQAKASIASAVAARRALASQMQNSSVVELCATGSPDGFVGVRAAPAASSQSLLNVPNNNCGILTLSPLQSTDGFLLVSVNSIAGYANIRWLALKAPAAKTDTCSIILNAIVTAKDGTYLGRIAGSFGKDSLFNQFSAYGNKFSSKSIWNEFGRYGGEFSRSSPFNEFTRTPPSITKEGKLIGYLTANTAIRSGISVSAARSCFPQ